MENIIQNKWFKISKTLIAGILVLSAIIALLASWYADKIIKLNDSFSGEPEGVAGLRVALLILGFIGILVAIFTFANSSKEIPVMIGFTLSVIFIVILLSMASVVMSSMDYNIVVTKK